MSENIRLRVVALLPLLVLPRLSGVTPAASLPAPSSPSAVDAADKYAPDAEATAVLIDDLSVPERRVGARERLLANPPRAALVALLEDASLRKRVAALDVLEEIGGVSAFDPWAAPGDAANAAPLQFWKKWAAEKSVVVKPGGALDDERRLSYLRDVLGENADRARRAGAMFERDGARSLGFLEKFLRENPALPAGSRGRVRAVEYRIALSRALGDRAPEIAESLVFGSRDRILAALESLRTAGGPAVPVLRDFVVHPDPLVRESAFDIILVCGRAVVFPIVVEALRDESDSNVIHGALRSMKDIRTPEAAALVAGYVRSADEEVALSALRTAVGQTGERRTGRSEVMDKAVVEVLDSPHWRIRAAALEYVAVRTPAAAREKVVRLLDDKDDFVRAGAMKAATTMRIPEALPKLRDVFFKDTSGAGPIFAAFAESPSGSGDGDEDSTKSPGLDEAMVAKLLSAEPEAKLAVIQVAGDHRNALEPVVLRLAEDKDQDVACAALRVLAGKNGTPSSDVFPVILAALRNGSEAKRLAVLRVVRLNDAASESDDPESGGEAEPDIPEEKTALDGMFDDFSGPKVAADPKPVVPKPVEPAAGKDLFDDFGAGSGSAAKAVAPAAGVTDSFLRETIALMKSDSEAVRLAASVALAVSGHAEGLDALAAGYSKLDTSTRSTLAERVSPAGKTALPLYRLLLNDRVEQVSAEAASKVLSAPPSSGVAKLTLETIDAPDARLRAPALYGWNFESAVSDPKLPDVLKKWAVARIAGDEGRSDSLVLATLALRGRLGVNDIAHLTRLARESRNVSVRRACWYALLSSKPALLPEFAESVAGDASPHVRAALPAVCIGPQSGFRHRFDDLHEQSDSRWDRSVSTPRITDAVATLLVRLAEGDPSPEVRFDAQFALMAQQRPFDADGFARMMTSGDAKSDRIDRVTTWVRSNLGRLTPAMRPVIAAIRTDHFDEDDMGKLRRRIGASVSEVALTFEAAGGARETVASTAVATKEPESPAAPVAKTFAVVFFHKPGCRECAKTREYLAVLKKDFPDMRVEEHDILDPKGVLLNQTVCSRLDIPAAKHALAPAVFTRAGVLVGAEISPVSLSEMFSRTRTKSGDDAWRTPDRNSEIAAAKKVDAHYDSLTLGVVLLAGLIDGVNPCAFATIIFFLSYLRITRRTSREMLMTGSAFIAGVFVAYLAAGLALYRVIDALSGFTWLQRGMSIAFGGLALVAAGLSLVDAVRARRGRLDEMTLKLPRFLGDRIRTTIREGAKARAFVTAAFVTGIVVSFIELACTGQVYAPIIYKIRQGDAGAIGMLTAYNVAFILPLVALFVATWFGMKNETMLAFQKRHTFAVKLALAALFLGLAALIFAG